jgi:hypothetical protein
LRDLQTVAVLPLHGLDPARHGTIGPGLLVEAETRRVNRASRIEEGPSDALEFLAQLSATGLDTGPTGGIGLGADHESFRQRGALCEEHRADANFVCHGVFSRSSKRRVL